MSRLPSRFWPEGCPGPGPSRPRPPGACGMEELHGGRPLAGRRAGRRARCKTIFIDRGYTERHPIPLPITLRPVSRRCPI